MKLATLLETDGDPYKDPKVRAAARTALLKVQSALVDNAHTNDLKVVKLENSKEPFTLEVSYKAEKIQVWTSADYDGTIFLAWGHAKNFSEDCFDEFDLTDFANTIVRCLMNDAGELTESQKEKLLVLVNDYLRSTKSKELTKAGADQLRYNIVPGANIMYDHNLDLAKKFLYELCKA